MTEEQVIARKPRADYMSNAITHREYYAQFVSDDVRALVARSIGVDRIHESVDRDGAFNDIPLRRWDAMVPLLGSSVARALKECGDWLSLGTGVCILKEAARQLKERS
jgi:hypothetical protein